MEELTWNYLSDTRPEFESTDIDCGSISVYRYQGNLKSELSAGTIDAQAAISLLEDMLMVREMEEMIVKLRSGAYEPLLDFSYRGPTHVSVGQEGTSVGACSSLILADYITSTHRGHGDSLARGNTALRLMSDEQLLNRLPGAKSTSTQELLDLALEEHLYRTLAELFGKEEGYCRGRGGSMHIADFTVGHLGANAIVGGNVPISTGAALGARYLRNGAVCCCFAGDGAYSNGVVLESLNFAAQAQFTNEMSHGGRFGLPIIFLVVNNHYGMTHRTDDEVVGITRLARRAAGFSDNNMHAETVNGMDVLAVRDAVARAADGCRKGDGPYFLELVTYRYYGHSLSDPRSEYRTREEESAWRARDPIKNLQEQLASCGVLDRAGLDQLTAKVEARNGRAARRAADSPDPEAEDVIKYMYTAGRVETVPEPFRKYPVYTPLKSSSEGGEFSYRDAIHEALFEEMARDGRVIFYGEDVADYGGAFKVTKGLLEAFGRNRVFNTPISEAAICGTAVGAAMVGLRPVVELMYMDFTLMSSDQISNQAAKWHYMSGGQVEVPLVIRVSVGGGKGYAGQHSQSLESMFAHIPGLYVVYPATPRDAKGLLKSAIRDNNPVMFVESQLLYGLKGPVPEEDDHLTPLGVAEIKREGSDITLVAWGPAVHDALRAADELFEKAGASAEVIDLRCLVPLDLETLIRSVQKTGRCVVASQSVHIGSFTAEISSSIQERAFDYLDAPIIRVGARNGIAPQSHILEEAFLPSSKDIVRAAESILNIRKVL